jgi:hypothetical protein
MVFRLGFICVLLANSLAYSNQGNANMAIEFEDEDYSSIEEDLRLLEEEDKLHN